MAARAFPLAGTLVFPGAIVLAGAIVLSVTAGVAEAGDDEKKISPADVVVETPVYNVPAYAQRKHELWRYNFSWSGVPVGHAEVESEFVGGEEGAPRRIDARISGSSNKFLDFFWRYRLDARGSLDADPVGPRTFVAVEQERKKRKFTNIEYHDDGMIDARRQKGDEVSEFHFRAPNVHSLLSTLLLALDLDHEIGRHYEFDVLTGTSRYLVVVDVDAREMVEVMDREPVDTFRLRVATSSLTDPEDDKKHAESLLWVSAENPRRLLKARSKTFVGAIYLTLASVTDVAATDALPAISADSPRASLPTEDGGD